MKNMNTKGHKTMKRFLLPIALLLVVTGVQTTLGQDVATRRLILRGLNTNPLNVGTLTVTSLTAPRNYLLPDADGNILLSPTGVTLSPNSIVVTNANSQLVTQSMNSGQLVIGKSDGTYAIASPTGARGLVVNGSSGALEFALPTGTTNSLLRYDGSAWVATSGFAVTSNGSLTVGASSFTLSLIHI